MSLQWHGDEQLRRTIRALQYGIDATTSVGTQVAKDLVHKDTGTLQGSIRPEPAKITGEQVVGAFGPHDVKYARYQEFLPPSRGGKTYMRPAEQQAKKVLQSNIKKAYG